MEDLGLDSLDSVEVVMAIEEVCDPFLPITPFNELTVLGIRHRDP